MLRAFEGDSNIKEFIKEKKMLCNIIQDSVKNWTIQTSPGAIWVLNVSWTYFCWILSDLDLTE